MGDVNWRLLVEAERLPVLQGILETARAGHREWVTRCFDGALPPAPDPERERRLDLLFAATDFYVWKLLRRDLGRSPEAVHDHVRATVAALVAGFGA